jgi:hypothetical protein
MLEPALGFGALAADHDRVDGAEQADDHEGDGRAQSAQQGVDRAEAGALFGVVDALAQHEVGDVDQFGDGGGGQARIPGPPGVPGGARPNGAEHDGQEEEHGADFHGCDFEAVPFHILGDEVDDACHGGQDESQQAHPGRADVEIEHALDVAHHGFGGGEDEREVGGDAQDDDGWTISRMVSAMGLDCMETP